MDESLRVSPTWAISRAEDAYASGDASAALEWLAVLDPSARPSALEASACYSLAKDAIGEGSWPVAEKLLARAQSVHATSLYQRRLELIRKKEAGLGDREYKV